MNYFSFLLSFRYQYDNGRARREVKFPVFPPAAYPGAKPPHHTYGPTFGRQIEKEVVNTQQAQKYDLGYAGYPY